MKCYYEVLDVSQDVDEAEIKAAYRKMALKWHPDKNLENPVCAKEQFQLVQQAYEVLSDRQERAWYDNHREQILRGCNSEFQDNSLDVFQYFTATCFQGYGDDENGFYTVYRNIFEKLAKEDLEFIEEKETYFEIPNFGMSTTDFQKVSEFYAYWLNYSTKKSFVWLDPYDIQNIRDRRYIKLVEKENKKIRQKAKKERNEEIRNLAAFVKKRDKRVLAQKKIKDQKLLDDKKKREMLSKQKRLERQEELTKARVSEQAEWSKFDNVKSELEEIERHLAKEFGELSNSEDNDDGCLDNLYCVACSKVFKTPKAFKNHESSKKHKENMEHLFVDEEEIGSQKSLNYEYLRSSDEYLDSDNEEKNYDTEVSNSDKIEIKHDLDKPIEKLYASLNYDSLEDNKTKKKKKRSKIIGADSEETNEALNFEVSSDDLEFNSVSTKKQKKKKKSLKPKTNGGNGIENIEENETKTTPVLKNKKDKKSQKEIINEVPEIDINHVCVTCSSNFPSKNKLFEHLKKTGHGIYIPSNIKNKDKNSIKSK